MDSDEVFAVERILSHRTSADGKRAYLVKWLNYEIETSTWEPEENLFCRRLINDYWKDPRPNLSLKKIVDDEMVRQIKGVAPRTMEEEEVEEHEIEESSSEELTSDTDDLIEEEAKRLRLLCEKPQPEFNYRAFLKLGFTVSALVVMIFILWGGGDQHYMSRYSSAQFQEQHPHNHDY